MLKKLYTLCLAGFLFSSNLYSQELFQAYYNIMNPIMMDGEGYAGHSLGFNVLYDKIGFELEWARTRKKYENRYWYINPQFKLLLSSDEGSEVSKYSYLTIGFNHFWALKNTSFTGRAEKLTVPPWDTLEGAQVYNVYNVFAKQKSSFFQIGFEHVAEKHEEVQGFLYYINPVTWAITTIQGEGPGSEIDFTRTFRLSMFVAPPGWLRLDQVGYEPKAGSDLPPGYPTQNVVLDPVAKNMVGLRMGLQWTTLNVGSSFGLEMTMVPGVFSRPGVYGRDFPDDNIFIKVNFGLAIGTSGNN